MRVSTVASTALLCIFLTASSAQADDCGLKLIASVDVNTTDALRAPLLPVTISGHATYMLLDTGAVYSMISSATADALSLPRNRSAVQVFDVGRDESSAYVTTPLTLGRLTTDH